MTQRCGIVALVGAPNAGKSTLLNQAVGAKISIVTHKVQTTRARLRGIALSGESQIVFVDTPGLFQPKRRLERAMVAAAWAGVEDADLVLLLHDVQRGRPDGDALSLIEELARRARRLALVLNKIDTLPREKLLDLATAFEATGHFERIFMISASKRDGVDDLLAWVAGELPEGPWLYPEDQLSDQPERALAAEVTREKLFLLLHQEIPYSLTVETERWEDFDDGSVKIEQTIYVQREGHKRIVIGQGGRSIRAARESAQKDLEEMLGRKVHLFLFVKVREGWLDDPERYRAWGLDFEA
jgi:GTP-binding protein Era